jgi:uncharacterized protein
MLTPWSDCTVADAHTHFFSRAFFDALGRETGEDAAAVAAKLGWDLPPEDPVELAKRWVAELDSYDLSRTVLIASIPGDEASVLAAAAAFPNRFYAYAMVNPLREGAKVTPGLKAICLFPAMHGYSIQDERVEPFLEQAAGMHCAVFVHCGVLTVGVRKKLGLPCPYNMRFSNPLDLHAVARRHLSNRFIVPHFGAGYFREALMLADLCPNVYLDTSSSNAWMRYEGLDLTTVLRRALDVAGPKRLLFGTDSAFFPRGWIDAVFQLQTRTMLELGVSVDDARLILGENLARLLES